MPCTNMSFHLTPHNIVTTVDFLCDWLQIPHSLSGCRGIFYFRLGAGANVSTDIYNVNFIGHVDLAPMHIVEHFFSAFRPDFVIAGMSEEAYTDDNVALQCQTLLCLHESDLKPGAAAEGDDFIFPDHFLCLFCDTQIKGVFIKNHANSIVIQSIYRLDIVDEGPDTTALTIYQFFELLN